MPQEFWSNAIFSVIPTIAVGAIFWFVMAAIIRSDRTERSSYAKIEAQERAKMAAQSSEAERARTPQS